MIEIFQKVKRRPKKLLNRENYHVRRQLGKSPTRYKKYNDLNDEEKARWKEQVRLSQLKRRKTDEKYRKLLSYRAKEYQQAMAGNSKECSKCHQIKGWCAFDLRDPKKPRTKWQNKGNTSKRTLRPECKECRKQYNKEQYARRVHQAEELQAVN